jgi:hypothetical protein
VRWIEEQTGSEEPEHPAPTLKLAKGSGGDHHDDAEAKDGAAAEKVSAHDAGGESHESHDSGPSGVAIGGLIAGIAGLILGAVALVRTRKTS